MWLRVPSLVFLVAGLASAFHPTLLSGFRLVQTDQGDTRLVNYILEQSYRWLVGLIELHPISLWDQPMFFPTPNVGAFSEILLGSAPFYWVFRALRFAPDTSLQLWMMAVLAANFVAMDLFLRRCLEVRPLAAAIGAFLFAFAGPRVVQMGHQQLLPQFFTVVAMYALYRLLQPFQPGAARYIYLFCFSAAGQLWASYYLGWFLFLGTLALAIAIFCSRERPARLRFLAAHRASIAGAALLSLLSIAPMLYHYSQALRLVGPRHFADAVPMIPPLQSWLYLGPDSWFYSWQRRFTLFQRIAFEHEQRLGIGWLTLPLAVLGCYGLSRSGGGWARLGMRCALAILLVVTLYPGGFTPWRLFFNILPGANAIRAVSRMVFLMLVPLSIGLAWFVQTRSRPLVGWLIGAICVLEQGHTTVAYDKLEVRKEIAAIAGRIGKDCLAFYYSPVFATNAPGIPPEYKFQIDAVWATIESGIPTINGYSGNGPKGWSDLADDRIVDDTSYSRLRGALRRWSTTHGLDPRTVCWIGPPWDRAALMP